ncbi:MAG: hypothetical protein AAGE96_04815 [Cyanobacteria bacterium P01_G01_bin.19]
MLDKQCMFILTTIIAIALVLISESRPSNASECPHVNFMVVDGKCINLDAQMKTKPKREISNSVSDLDDLTGSSLATYASLLSLVGGGAAGYKFLVRK